MNNSKIKTGISLYRILSRAYFYLPFLTIFFFMKGLDIFQIEIILSIYGTSSLLTAVLLKQLLAIHISERNLLLLSELLKVFSFIFLLLPINIILYTLAQTLLGASYSIAAGIDTAIIHQSVDDNDGSFQAKTNSYMFNSLLISGLMGSLMFEENISLPIIATMIAALLCIISLSFYIPNRKIEHDKQAIIKDKSMIKLKKRDEALIINYSFLRGIILTLFTGFLPLHFFVDLKIDTYYFILILTSYTLIGSFSSRIIPKYTDKLMLSEICLLLSLLFFTSDKIYMILAGTVLLGISSGPIRPVTANSLKENGNVNYGLELAEKLYAFINVFFLIAGGYLYLKYDFFATIILALTLYFTHIILLITIKLKKEKKRNF